MADRDKTIAIRGRDMNVLQWANQRAAQLKRSGNL